MPLGIRKIEQTSQQRGTMGRLGDLMLEVNMRGMMGKVGNLSFADHGKLHEAKSVCGFNRQVNRSKSVHKE